MTNWVIRCLKQMNKFISEWMNEWIKVDVPGKRTILSGGICTVWPAGDTNARKTPSCEPEGDMLLCWILSSWWNRRIPQVTHYSPNPKKQDFQMIFLSGFYTSLWVQRAENWGHNHDHYWPRLPTEQRPQFLPPLKEHCMADPALPPSLPGSAGLKTVL